jgi:hypothetical protein
VHFEHFIASWSKCFGSSNSEGLHWKRVLNEHEFKRCNKKLINIRNRAVAHTDTDLTEIEVPNFDTALAELIFLYRELVKVLGSFEQLVVHAGPACIEMWRKNVIKESQEYIQTASKPLKF